MNNETDSVEQTGTLPQYLIEESAQRARAGQATPEDQALLAGFEMGGSEAQINRPPNPVEPTPAAEDLLGASNRRIQQLDDAITTEKMWGNNTSAKETELKGHQDMASYLKGRDFKDSLGKVHDATSGQFVPESQANQRFVEQDTTANENMPLVGLLKKWADAEVHNDRTISSDVQDEILHRLETNSKESEEDKAEIIDALYDRMNRLKNSMQPDPEESTLSTEIVPDDTNGDQENTLKSTEDPQIKPEIQETPPDDTAKSTPLVETETTSKPAESNNQVSDDEVQETPAEIKENLDALLIARQNEFKAAALDYAIAKVGVERIFAGKDRKQDLREAGERLATAHEAYMLANDAVIEISSHLIDNYLDEIIEELVQATKDRDDLLATKVEGTDFDTVTQSRLNRINETIVGLEQEKIAEESEIEEENEDRENQKQALRLQSLNELSKTVEDQMLAERTKAHPKLTKINDWLAKHPKTRLGVGLGLSAAGVVGAATFNAPLVGLSLAGRGILSGYGSYNASRAVGEMIANRQLRRAEINQISDFIDISEKQSTTRRISKQAGVAVASVMTVVPAITRLVEAHHASAVSRPTRPTPPTPTPPTPPPSGGLPRIAPIDGNLLPWTYGMDVLHTNISSPDILNKLVDNSDGIRFIGNGLGGGNGAITSVIIPGQGTFSDVGHINAAMAYILGKG